MATVVNPTQNVGQVKLESEEALPKINWSTSIIIFLVGAAAIGLIRWYQEAYSFQYGLDYFEPEFATYWMSVLYTELTLIALFCVVGAAWVWFTRPKEVIMTPQHELKLYLGLLAALAGIGVLAPIAAQLFVEADAAWHQVTIRDTDFTPTHIILFYGLIPAALAGGIVGFLWVHTRMPDFRNRVSFNMALAISGVLLVMPNLGFNEWGHTFFYAEELFAAPIHWGFVTLGWAVFALGGLIVQILNRIVKLTRTVSELEAETGNTA